MKSGAHFSLVFVTAPDLKTARALAKSALKARLVACANLLPGIESHYRWQGKIEAATEVLIIFKTLRANLPALEKLILAEHPYDTPEIISLTLNTGNEKYLDWIKANCAPDFG